MTQQTKRNHAIVIGGSIAGMLTARVLADFAAQVTIIERDILPTEPARRKGTPQGAQFHSLHQTGAEIVRELFPDLPFDMETSGLIPADIGADIHAFMYGGWLPKVHVGSNIFWCDRPHFEWALRQRVAALPNVKLSGGVSVTELVYDAAEKRMSGVKVKDSEGRRIISADLIIDASGRGSRLPQWLKSLGFTPPEQSELRINMGDVTATFQLPPAAVPTWKAMLIGTIPGQNNKLGGAHLLPNNQLRVLLAGVFGDHPPTDEAEFIAFSRQLAQPDLYKLLQQATLISPIRGHKLPSNQWRHYEKVRDLPAGLFVLGDSVCSFNPGYGQGMTIAAMHVAAMRAEFGRLQARNQPFANRRFQKAAAKISQTAWMNATTEDLRYPEAIGDRPLPVRFMQGYLSKLMATAHGNADVTKRFYEVMTLRRSLVAMFYPDVLWAMARHSVQRRMPVRHGYESAAPAIKSA